MTPFGEVQKGTFKGDLSPTKGTMGAGYTCCREVLEDMGSRLSV